MGAARLTLIAFSIATIFSIGLTSTLVYGGAPVPVPVPVFDDNFVHAEWINPSPIPTLPSVFDSLSSSGLQLFDLATVLVPAGGQQGLGVCLDTLCEFTVTNFIDDLDRKIIQIHITWGPPGATPPSLPTIQCLVLFASSPSQFVDGDEEDTFTSVTFDCEPNPDWEIIRFDKDPATIIQRVQIWTTSFDDIVVGGTYIPIDTTALLLAGVQSISMWMIPVVAAGVGIGVFVIIRRK